jgi:hypothetical protein
VYSFALATKTYNTAQKWQHKPAVSLAFCELRRTIREWISYNSWEPDLSADTEQPSSASHHASSHLSAQKSQSETREIHLATFVQYQQPNLAKWEDRRPGPRKKLTQRMKMPGRLSLCILNMAHPQMHQEMVSQSERGEGHVQWKLSLVVCRLARCCCRTNSSLKSRHWLRAI